MMNCFFFQNNKIYILTLFCFYGGIEIRRATLIFITLLIFLITLISARADITWQSTVIPYCNPCIEGFPGSWQVSITNTAKETFSISAINLVDKEGAVFAKKEFNSTKLKPNETAATVIEDFLPAPLKGSTLYYQACFQIEGQQGCENYDRELFVTPFSSVECINNSYCECANYKCISDNKTTRLLLYNLIAGIVLIVLVLIAVLLLARKTKKRRK